MSILIRLKNHAGCFRFVFLLSRLIIGYTELHSYTITHLSDEIKLVNNGLLTYQFDDPGLTTRHKTYQKRQWRYQNGFYCDDIENRDLAMQMYR